MSNVPTPEQGQQLDPSVAAHEQLFADSDVAYLQTDPVRASSDNRRAYAFQRLADAASDIAEQDSPAETLRHIANQARAALACDEVGVTLARHHGVVETPAATGELACECDRLQFELGEGPSFGALDEAAPISVPDMRTDSRWPRFAPRAAENSLPTRSPRMRPLPSRMPRWKAICARRWPVERRSGGPSAF